MINFTLKEIKLLRIMFRTQEDDPTDEELAYIDSLGEEKVLKIMEAAEKKVNKIAEIREKNK